MIEDRAQRRRTGWEAATPELGEEAYGLLRRLFPICRSLTGEGVRETLSILREFIPLEVTEIPSGTRCFDWTIPQEWNIREAWIKDRDGNEIVSFADHNLSVVGYSVPHYGWHTLDELQPHLSSLPEQPDAIPYVTSYYDCRWGFCLTHKRREQLREGSYEVLIDSTLEPGSMSLADLVIPGKSEEEILLSTYVCHPSMANNELSGPVVTTMLARELLRLEERLYTYRFVFVPETIGAIAYLSRHLKHLKRVVVAGYVVTCCGDPGPFSYLHSRHKDTLVDRVSRHVLKCSGQPYKLYSFLERGSDERQYCAPGVDLPVGSLMRAKYGTYPEYHTSLDDLNLVTSVCLGGTIRMYLRCLEALERNAFPRTAVLCEPQLGRRGLYPTLSRSGSAEGVRDMMNLIAYADGEQDMIAIAEKVGCSIFDLLPYAEQLSQQGLLVLMLSSSSASHQ